MSGAILAVREAVQAHLLAQPELTALIGPGRIHDEAPRAAKGVYVVHGDADAQDWSTGSDRGCEQRFALIVWAAESTSARRALEAAAIIVAALDRAALGLSGHRLINLGWLSSVLARDGATRRATITIRFRAVTETL